MSKLELPPIWESFLSDELKKEYFLSLSSFVIDEYKNNSCYPPIKELFNAFKACVPNKVRVVILGQDPYPSPNHANGLCFSVNKGITLPASLKNIFKELHNDLAIPYPNTGDLSPWAKQGVFLLNTTLSVTKGKAGSHQKKGWETLTNTIIQQLSKSNKHLVFMLWGKSAQQKIKLIDTQKHLILTSGHPSPLSANKGHWFGNKHFSKCNTYLLKQQLKPIDWSIQDDSLI